LIKIHFALSAQAAGIDSIQIDISGITRSLEEIGAQVRSLQLVADPTFA
jgi:hypothetical protein